jgi:hypothetical protein
MNRLIVIISGAIILTWGVCAAAQTSEAESTSDSNGIDKQTTAGRTAKPSAPIRFRYEIQGNPIVGQPVAVNVFLMTSMDTGKLTLHYRVNDSSSMLFPESQPRSREIVMEASGFDSGAANQITVVPQREGRLFLNVSAEIVTDTGDVMIKTQAIPIQVGPAPLELDENGELKETASGETVVSLPAN